ncbi:phosphotransferase [Microbacterium sp. BWT-B31]|uniref:phosphotransferase n=1 Tax=Microbacterium sp. BWT-B31 TaxID=3232072 RepID=UPI0035271D5D
MRGTTSATQRHGLPGLDLDRLAPWLTEHVGSGADLTARRLAGGKSNLTSESSDGASSWVLRRPPLGHVLATAHDMAREYRTMSALHATGGRARAPRRRPHESPFGAVHRRDGASSRHRPRRGRTHADLSAHGRLDRRRNGDGCRERPRLAHRGRDRRAIRRCQPTRPDPLGFYLGLAALELAGIIEGIRFRHLRGETVGTGFEGIGEAIHPMLDAGLSALDQ